MKAAEAEAEARYLQGLGISRQRQAILNGLRDSVADFAGKHHGLRLFHVVTGNTLLGTCHPGMLLMQNGVVSALQ